MAQELTFNISEDRRKLQGPVEAKNFNLKFGTDGVAITHGNPKQWVQGRIGDKELKQVFVNITEGENNTPKDVAGLFLAFVGIIHDKDGRPHRVVDYKHSTTIDVEHGRFRFDFPDQAFTVAGEYQQAFFMLVKEGPGGGCVATMEFDMQVMANFVFTDLVPEDYITPFNDTVDQLLAACKKFKDDTAADEAKFKQELEDAYAKFQKDTNTQFNNFKDATNEDLANFKKANADDIAKFKQQYADAVQAKEDELQSKVDSYTDKIDTMLKDLNQQGIDTTTMLNDLRSQMAALQDKIKNEHLFTEDEAKQLEQRLNQSLATMFGDPSLYKEPGEKLVDKIINEADDRGINVRHFGATGDGKTDDTEAFQNAIDYAAKHNNASVIVPAGKYVISKELTLKFIELRGEGVISTTLIPKNVSRLITLIYKSSIRNIRINNSENEVAIADICLAPISGDVGTNNIVKDIYIEDSGDHEVTGILAAPKTNAANQNIFTFPNVVSNITMSNVYNGIHLLSSGSGWINGNSFENIVIQGFRNTGLWLDAGKNRVSISHNSFYNIQVQYQKMTPATARAFKINFGVNNKFTMLHTWQDQGTNVPIPSMELKPAEGVNPYEIRNNEFDGIFESEIDADQITKNYNDLSQIKLSYWLTTSFKNGYGAINRPRQYVENLLPSNLIADYVNGVRSPLQLWGWWHPVDKSIDEKGYYIKAEPINDKKNGGSFGLMLNRIGKMVNKLDKFTLVFDFDIGDQDNQDIWFSSSAVHFNDNDQPEVLPKKYHQMTRMLNGVYRYYETFDNSKEDTRPLAIYCVWNGCDYIKLRGVRLLPNWIGPMQSIIDTRVTHPWSIDSDTKLEFSNDKIIEELGISLIPNAATNDWFDKNLVVEKQRSNGRYIYTYPIYI